MRTRLLPIAAAGLMLCTIACSRSAPEYRTDATVKDIMDSVVDPSADFIWESVSTTSTLEGIIEKEPQNDEEWREVRRHTVALMEATNLLQIPGRRVAKPGEKADDPRVELAPDAIQTLIDADPASWSQHARGLYDATAPVLKAIEAKDKEALLNSSDKIDQACEACHLKYWYPRQVQEQKDPSSTSMKKN